MRRKSTITACKTPQKNQKTQNFTLKIVFGKIATRSLAVKSQKRQKNTVKITELDKNYRVFGGA